MFIKWENEREDFKLQIQELEQLLEEERQTYEYNRRSVCHLLDRYFFHADRYTLFLAPQGGTS